MNYVRNVVYRSSLFIASTFSLQIAHTLLRFVSLLNNIHTCHPERSVGTHLVPVGKKPKKNTLLIKILRSIGSFQKSLTIYFLNITKLVPIPTPSTRDRLIGMTLKIDNLFRKNFSILIFSCVISTSTCPAIPKEQWIIIHGTFATNNEWYHETGKEHQALLKSIAQATHNHFTLHDFKWSGEHNHAARVKAAESLLSFLEHLTPPYHIVAHSFGASIALLAAQKMFEQKRTFHIAELFCLGAPLYHGWYPDAPQRIGALYNLFSYGDMVQTLASLFERTFPPRSHIHNLQVKLNHSCPRHADLHNPAILTQLPRLRTLIQKPGIYCLHVTSHKEGDSSATLEPEASRQKDLEIDQNFSRQLVSLYGESRHKKKINITPSFLFYPSSLKNFESLAAYPIKATLDTISE